MLTAGEHQLVFDPTAALTQALWHQVDEIQSGVIIRHRRRQVGVDMREESQRLLRIIRTPATVGQSRGALDSLGLSVEVFV